ncbi:isopentenyl-diphosphate Delta-isomerase [Arthrobacter sp. KK5.5]|uniref:isopentenyl-diphosphate Delta-isomerase n=1 Tax=Arthrobacter sp. KK5.5 TaxID=3373084 RepID=UPI003EE5C712
MSQDGNVPESVVLLDGAHGPIGTAPKATIHTEDTPLHLAFSCHIFNSDGRVLATRRALDKKAWPGVWTNSVCGHPGPGEDMADAVRRRARFELGLDLDALALVLPDFRYRAVDASGIVENEFCPVYFARASGEPDPVPGEVADFHWVRPEDLLSGADATPWAFSPWMVWQLEQLAVRGLAYAGPGA